MQEQDIYNEDTPREITVPVAALPPDAKAGKPTMLWLVPLRNNSDGTTRVRLADGSELDLPNDMEVYSAEEVMAKWRATANYRPAKSAFPRRTVVRKALARLEKRGVVGAVGRWPRRRYGLTDAGRAAQEATEREVQP